MKRKVKLMSKKRKNGKGSRQIRSARKALAHGR